MSRHLRSGALDELTLTTNGTRLAEFAHELAAAGVRRVNVSLDTLDPERFRRVTRRGDIDKVLAGIEAAVAAGLNVKINTVALRGENEFELPSIIRWAHGRGSTSPSSRRCRSVRSTRTGPTSSWSLATVRARLAGSLWTLDDVPFRSGEPATTSRYRKNDPPRLPPADPQFLQIRNRVDHLHRHALHVPRARRCGNLRAPLRRSASDEELHAAIDDAIRRKPQGMTSSSTGADRSLRSGATHERDGRVNAMAPAPDPLKHDPLETAERWLAAGRRIALATVAETWGSAPVQSAAIS